MNKHETTCGCQINEAALPKLSSGEGCCSLLQNNFNRIAISGFLVLVVAAAGFLGYWYGSSDSPKNSLLGAGLPPEVLRATATHGGANLAVATGRVSEDSDGIFFLDFITGNLQCWVYYPRLQKFGAKFETNVTRELPATKNAEYLLVTGESQPAATASNARPGGCLAYVIDVKSGQFAAYVVPYVRAAETSGQQQMAQLIPVDGGVFRNPLPGGASKKPSGLNNKPGDKAPAEKAEK